MAVEPVRAPPARGFPVEVSRTFSHAAQAHGDLLNTSELMYELCYRSSVSLQPSTPKSARGKPLTRSLKREKQVRKECNQASSQGTEIATFGNVLDEGRGPPGDAAHEGAGAAGQALVREPEEVGDAVAHAAHQTRRAAEDFQGSNHPACGDQREGFLRPSARHFQHLGKITHFPCNSFFTLELRM